MFAEVSAKQPVCFGTAAKKQDKILINQFKRITALSEENKIVVSTLIDAFLFQQ